MKKGGYQIIDLKDYNITTDGVTIKGIYDDINTNRRKVILLSGVTIKGVEFSDMFVKVVKAGTDFRLTGYSVAVDNTLSTYDFFVEDDDKVSLIEGEVEGGSSGMENPMTTAGDMIVGGEDGAPTALPIGTAGQVLKVGADGPEWGVDSAGMTNPMTTAGDMIGGSIDGAPYRIPKGTQGQVLTMGASFPEWVNAQGGHLYQHTITYHRTSATVNVLLTIVIYNNDATLVDSIYSLKSKLFSIYGTSHIPVNGYCYTNTGGNIDGFGYLVYASMFSATSDPVMFGALLKPDSTYDFGLNSNLGSIAIENTTYTTYASKQLY